MLKAIKKFITKKQESKKKLYVIGAVTGIPDDNRPLFEAVRDALEVAGYEVEIPHDTIPAGTDWQTAMRQSITRLLAADGVAVIPEWIFSTGATIEYHICCDLKIPVGCYERWLELAEEAAR